MSSLDFLVSMIADLKDRSDAIPSVVWGTLVSTQPDQVRLDGETALVAAAGVFGAAAGKGQRVLCLIAANRLYAFSAESDSANIITIGGVRYPASGSVAVQVGSWTYTKNDLNATTLQIPLPFAPPVGWTVETFTLETNGFTLCQTGSLDRANKRVYVRVTQPLSRELSALGRVGWRLVKE